MTSTRISGDDATVDAIAELAEAASGEYRDQRLALAESVVGLPDEVTVLVRDGKDPRVEGLKGFFEPYRRAPERREGTAQVTTLQSFIDLTNRHKDADSALFGLTTWPNPKLTAVIDYHRQDGSARFGRHRIAYAFPLTPEFKLWVEGNAKSMTQADFANFVEERIADLGVPYDAEAIQFERLFRTKIATPSDMVELSRGLQVHVAAVAKNAVTLQSGEGEVVFKEEHQNAQGEKITVPGVFLVAVRAFVDGEPVRIAARLRYRLREGRLTWTYLLYNWDMELRERVLADLGRAATDTALPAYEGTPETDAAGARS